MKNLLKMLHVSLQERIKPLLVAEVFGKMLEEGHFDSPLPSPPLPPPDNVRVRCFYLYFYFYFKSTFTFILIKPIQ